MTISTSSEKSDLYSFCVFVNKNKSEENIIIIFSILN